MKDTVMPQPGNGEGPGSPPCVPTTVAFADVVRAHAKWRSRVDRGGKDAREANDEYCRLLERFEGEYGKIVNAYWCSKVESAVALTARPRRFRRPHMSFHRVSDWATKGEPDIAALLHKCDELAVRARTVLTGLRKRICLELVMASASHLLSLVDERAAHGDAEKTKKAVAAETAHLKNVDGYYRDAANGQAQMVYFGGMGVTTVAVGALALIGGLFLSLPAIDDGEFYATLSAGAGGALISVIQRINSGKFDLDFDVGRPYLVFLGGLRPLMGAIFGLLVYFAVASAIVQLSPIPDGGTARLYALIVLAFAAGFSERWAQDTLIAAAVPGPKDRSEEEEAPSSAGLTTPIA